MLLREEGFTLTEVLIALILLTIGIVGVGMTLTFQSGGLSIGADIGLAAVTRANYVSTATMLAQERIELMRNSPYAAVAGVTEDYGFLGGYPGFKRVATVAAGPDPGRTKQVTVEVFFRQATESGIGPEASVKLVTIVGQRP